MSVIMNDRETVATRQRLLESARKIAALIVQGIDSSELSNRLTGLGNALIRAGLTHTGIQVVKASQDADDRQGVHTALKAVFDELDR